MTVPTPIYHFDDIDVNFSIFCRISRFVYACQERFWLEVARHPACLRLYSYNTFSSINSLILYLDCSKNSPPYYENSLPDPTQIFLLEYNFPFCVCFVLNGYHCLLLVHTIIFSDFEFTYDILTAKNFTCIQN